MIVDNGIIGDSRVQKCAKSVSDFGNEVLLLGRDLGNPETPTGMGSVKIARVPVDLTLINMRKNRQKHTPHISLQHFLAYRNQYSMVNAKNKLRMRKHIIKANRATGRNVAFALLTERFQTAWFVIRYRQYSNAWKKQLHRIGIVPRIRKSLFNIGKNPIHLFQISPSLYAFEAAYLQSAIDFQPDIIHAHDFRMSGAGVRLADALEQSGRRPKVIYDAHEFLEGITGFDLTEMSGYLLNEKSAVKGSDVVITVSDEIATLLTEKYKLSKTPSVVLNAPIVDVGSSISRSLRADCGLSDGVPLGVYLGGLAVKRGISPVLSAMVQIPELHFAFVANVTAYNQFFLDEARDLGVLDRVHLLPYVAPNEIVDYIGGASFGLAPYLHDINHEVSLPSKFYEYACARLPIVGSDVKVVKSTIEKFGIGEVFIAGDAETLAVAIKKVIGSLKKYKDSYEMAPTRSWTWSAQEDVLKQVYDSLR